MWTDSLVPRLRQTGALPVGTELSAGKKTLARLRWVVLVAQFGDDKFRRFCLQVSSYLLLQEDFDGESEDSDAEPGDAGPWKDRFFDS